MKVNGHLGSFRVSLTGREHATLPRITIAADAAMCPMRLQDYLTPDAATELARQLLNAADAARAEEREVERRLAAVSS